MDTPGILWPKFEDQSVGLRLALIGSIKDDILNIDELSLELIQILREEYPGVLKERYGMEEEGTPAEMLEKIALNRGCIKKGNEVDSAERHRYGFSRDVQPGNQRAHRRGAG